MMQQTQNVIIAQSTTKNQKQKPQTASEIQR